MDLRMVYNQTQLGPRKRAPATGPRQQGPRNKPAGGSEAGRLKGRQTDTTADCRLESTPAGIGLFHLLFLP